VGAIAFGSDGLLDGIDNVNNSFDRFNPAR
jgi:hypothetical protein